MNPIKRLIFGKDYLSVMNEARPNGGGNSGQGSAVAKNRRFDNGAGNGRRDNGYSEDGRNGDGGRNSPQGSIEAPRSCNPPRRDTLPEGEYDRGNERTVINLNAGALQNENYRTALWTGENMQLTVMSIPVGGETGAELHEDEDQLIKIVSGLGEIYFADREGEMRPEGKLTEEFAVIIPKGTRHNLKNIGNKELKLYSVYSPPHHPYGVVHKHRPPEPR